MAVDDRWKRASATALVVPSMFTAHTDTTNALDKEERWAVTWMYCGIAISAAEVWSDITIQGFDPISGEVVYIIGKYKT